MTQVLGYAKYGAQGGDWGALITIQLAVEYPGDLAGIHLNAATVLPAGDAKITEEEQSWEWDADTFSQRESDYAHEQRNKPETVAFALADNPLGTAAWITEKLKVWSDSGDNIESAFSKDDILSNIMVYLVTDSAPTAVWIYRGAREDTLGAPARTKINVPTGYATFPREMTNLAPPRSALERSFTTRRCPKAAISQRSNSPNRLLPTCASFSGKCGPEPLLSAVQNLGWIVECGAHGWASGGQDG